MRLTPIRFPPLSLVPLSRLCPLPLTSGDGAPATYPCAATRKSRPLDWRVRCKSDRLMLSFVADADRRAVAASDMEEGVTMHTDDSGRIVALSIADASNVVHRRPRVCL